ncbi:MAG: hypothetical protein ACQKBY_12595 [Verrucomicrobiales bacterium]
MSTPYQRSLLILCSCLLSACVWMKPIDERVGEARDEVRDAYQREVIDQIGGQAGGHLNTTWSQASSLMFHHNPHLIQSDYRVLETSEQGKQIWKNMLPSVTASINDSFLLGDFDEAFSDTTFRVSSYVALGNLLQLPTRLYKQKLLYLGAQLQAEQTMRQETITLYRLFQEQRLLDLEEKALHYQGEILKVIQSADAVEQATMRLQLRNDLETHRQNVQKWRQKVGDFFMTSYSEVKLRASDLPEIRYNASSLDFTDTKRWAHLQMSLLALEEIARDGQVLDTYLRYLPTANLSVSAPPLYNNTGGQSFDVNAIRIGPSLYWNLDTRGSISQQINRLRRNEPLQEWQKDKRRRDEITKLLEGKKALADVQEELAKVRTVMEQYKLMVKAGLVKDARTAVQKMKSLRTLEVQLMAKEIDICTSFWLIDEARWSSFTKQWHQTRPVRLRFLEQNKQSGFFEFLKKRF